ncbi:type IV pilus biogenesis/stability protein PilW [Ramlibacter tataouinensis]|uniref:Type 4 fimbrial biogenesis protein PilF-like protein n=1 Tax=Ramlibacter tataouinensis (strain ATCC BAA-407 / DSM 14655 / LMG 21543 / TTB310) TaxID=365046 RepID=F5XX39_RAMTT|nr:type IV pilus biogenesis/stability protein PilW [Ramlibacter tataouinensis]AEG92983.1 type 4 fimbrial biogenesis protein PilF-like protein [Ramlibacter tataouinensis TTB310]
MRSSGLARRGHGAAAWVPLVAAAWVALAGCAGTGMQPGARKDMVTESDEPEARKRARIRMELALGYFEQGQTSVALDEIKQVIASDPNFPQAYNLRGLIYMRLNDMGQAEDSFRRALSVDPRSGDTLHNYGWLQCQQRRYDESVRSFEQALANPTYGARAKTLMAQGLCQARAGRAVDAERSLARSYELDAANPVTGYNLARLLYQRGELKRSQFYIRRLNNSELSNSESLWLGIRVERRLGDRVAMTQLAEQLRRRHPQSRELTAYNRGAFDE